MFLRLFFLFLFFTGSLQWISAQYETPVEEAPFTTKYISKLGSREYLSPYLIGLQQLVNAQLPKTLKLLNVIEAIREITNTIQYDLLIRAQDDTDTEVFCHLVIKEKSFYDFQRFRVLDYTNCSSYYDHESNLYKESKYEISPPTSPRRLSANDIRDVESQIFPKTEHKIQEDNREDSNHLSNSKNENQNSKELSESGKEVLDSFFESFNSGNIETNKEPINYNSPKYNEDENVEAYFHDNSDYGVRTKRNVEFDSKDNIDLDNQQLLENYFGVDEIDELNYFPTTWLSQLNEDDDESLERIFYNLSNKSSFNEKAAKLYLAYEKHYNKTYNPWERAFRFFIFNKNLIKIAALNKMERGTARYGITEFTDMSIKEYKERTGLLKRSAENDIGRKLADIPDFKLPKEHDWRKYGAVSEVKNQGSCGSCWAFSVTGNIEGLHAVKTGKLEEYSEQELLDCDTTDSACEGGLPDDAYKAIEKLGGLELENDYPYRARKQKTCQFNSSLVHVKVKDAIDLPKNETAMALWLVANGPISIGINANAMQFYRGGISHPWKFLCSKNNLDHGVLIVGFGVKDYPVYKKTLPYWIVKNSWGKNWGEQGYYRIFRGNNACGISEMASSAVLE